KSQRLNKKNSNDYSINTSSELSIAIPTIQEQHDYTEWEDKKLKL
ncbi:11673_t:CDS:1, partial [Gigaspora margarita]